MSADPIVQDPTDTQSLNRYSYVGNNPLSYTDPTGVSFEEVTGSSRSARVPTQLIEARHSK